MDGQGFDGKRGWIACFEADVIFPAGQTWTKLGFKLVDEFVASDGTIFVFIETIIK